MNADSYPRLVEPSFQPYGMRGRHGRASRKVAKLSRHATWGIGSQGRSSFGIGTGSPIRAQTFGTVMTTSRGASKEQTEARTVLIVDDEPAIVDLLAQFLEDEGYKVESASDGKTALARITDQRPDLVIADVMMPKMDGFELLDELSENKVGVPVILMSAAVVSRREGVPFIAKPFDLGELLDLVNSHLN
jgi:CheY-like chemotaxis protein